MEKVKSFGTAGSGGAWSAVWVALTVTWDDVLTGAPEPPPEEDDEEPYVGTVVGVFVAAAVVRFTVMVATAFVFVRTGVFVASVDGSGAFVPGAGVTGGCLAWSWGERNTMTAIMMRRRMNPAATTGSNEECGPGSGVSMGVPPRGIPFREWYLISCHGAGVVLSRGCLPWHPQAPADWSAVGREDSHESYYVGAAAITRQEIIHT
jgi:hypothetical protein